jgi:hypothetical protein
MDGVTTKYHGADTMLRSPSEGFLLAVVLSTCDLALPQRCSSRLVRQHEADLPRSSTALHDLHCSPFNGEVHRSLQSLSGR